MLDLHNRYVSDHKEKWDQHLPPIEYAYENTVYTLTGKGPFERVKGGKKVPPILHTNERSLMPISIQRIGRKAYKKVKYTLQRT